MAELIRVLHTDDEPDFADLTATFLERENDLFTVETAPSASEGLDRLTNDDFDCVVSDYDMPGQNGIEFLRTVREEYPDLPFILFTGKGSEEVASEAISAGVTDYLQKETGSEQYTILANRIQNAVERTRAQRERQRHLDAIETAWEGISILDEDGRFVYVNEAYTDLYGYEPEEMVGEHWELIYRDDDTQRIHDEILPKVAENGHWHGETTGLRADGSTFVEDHTLATTANGELVCTIRDVTGHKERERELKRQNERLDEFASVVSHDLQNPLRVADGRLKLAQEEHDSEHLDMVADALDRMERIIDGALWLGRKGQDIGETESVDLHETVETAWTTVAAETNRAEIVYVDTEGSDPSTIQADYDRLRQLLENLFRNAIEHAGPDVTVRVEPTETGFAIEDDGPGIPPEERNRVFDTGYLTSGGGTGFGLGIVEQVAEAHGWDVHVTESETGGVRFAIAGVEFAQ